MTNIILCGFMGCGKSTVGQTLAGLTGMSFIDTDEAITCEAGMSVNEIFRVNGESHFRDLEHKICCELAQKSGLIIATGGGALTYERNVRALRSSGKIFFIDVPLDVIKARLAGDTSRPLLNSDGRDAKMKRLYDERAPLYRACAHTVVDGGLPAREVALNIMHAAGIS